MAKRHANEAAELGAGAGSAPASPAPPGAKRHQDARAAPSRDRDLFKSIRMIAEELRGGLMPASPEEIASKVAFLVSAFGSGGFTGTYAGCILVDLVMRLPVHDAAAALPPLLDALRGSGSAARNAASSLAGIAIHFRKEMAAFIANTEGAIAALVGALGNPAAAEGAASVLLQIVDASSELACRVAGTDGALDALLGRAHADCTTCLGSLSCMVRNSSDVAGALASRPAAFSTLVDLIIRNSDYDLYSHVNVLKAMCTANPSLLPRLASTSEVLAALGRVALPPVHSHWPLTFLAMVAKHSEDTARSVAQAEGMLRACAVAACTSTGIYHLSGRRSAKELLRALATVTPPATIAAAFAPQLSSSDDKERGHARAFLAKELLSLPPVVLDALQCAGRQAAAEAACLRAEVAEVRAIPVNTRAAIVELAGALRRGGA
ncbi:MAG: hypothetical protein J3K34DRAFT_412289 [Monoraphidium minutum]|nr:MAG: hypothetical protein J3K34DRAFT_412289 [Monoraphidium minutum]